MNAVNEDLQLAESAITSDLAFDSASSRRQLHLGACKQIERYILVPILKESKLKSFHTLAQSVPERIVNRQIVCLRDLEKTLLWLAPVSFAYIFVSPVRTMCFAFALLRVLLKVVNEDVNRRGHK